MSRRLPISASARCNKDRCRCAACAAADTVGPATTAAAPAKLPDPPPPPPPPPPPAPTPLLIVSSSKTTHNEPLGPQGPSFGGRRSPIWISGSLGLGLLKRNFSCYLLVSSKCTHPSSVENFQSRKHILLARPHIISLTLCLFLHPCLQHLKSAIQESSTPPNRLSLLGSSAPTLTSLSPPPPCLPPSTSLPSLPPSPSPKP